jgi:acyl-CoA thioesterase I
MSLLRAALIATCTAPLSNCSCGTAKALSVLAGSHMIRQLQAKLRKIDREILEHDPQPLVASSRSTGHRAKSEPTNAQGEMTLMKGFRALATYLLRPVLVAVGILTFATIASAQVVALGASNVSGYGVGSSAAFPAILESLLKQHGYDVSVTNAGIAGDTTRMVLDRLDGAVPQGTRVVILDANGCLWNNNRVGMDPKSGPVQVSEIVNHLKARGIKVVMMWKAGLGPNQRQYDGIHLSEEGHATVAHHLLPEIEAALGRSRYAAH